MPNSVFRNGEIEKKNGTLWRSILANSIQLKHSLHCTNISTAQLVYRS